MKNKIFIFLFTLALTCCLPDDGIAQQTIPPVPQPDADGRVITGRRESIHWKAYMKDADLSDYHHASPETVENFKDMKFGLRIHWGIYSMIHGKESWVMPHVYQNKPEFLAWYHDLHRSWYPSGFCADEWMQLAVDGGYKFFVFTIKHHDGFSMYDTHTKVRQREAYVGPQQGKLIEIDEHYSIMETPFKRDVTRELVDAARKRGIKVGLYYSNPDWYDGDARIRNEDGASWPYQVNSDPQAMERFRRRHRDQIRELLQNYGPVDLLCLDLDLDAVHWEHMKSTAKMARDLQPQVMMRWRGIGHYGDYQTPENVIPGEEDLGTMPWQVIHALSRRGIFSYEPDERQLHDGRWIVDKLVDIVAKGGNFMVGVGPDLSGRWHPKVVDSLKFAGQWLRTNGDAIFATRPRNPYREGDYVWFTQSKDHKTLYVFHRGIPGAQGLLLNSVTVQGLRKVDLMGCSQAVEYSNKEGRLWIAPPEKIWSEQNSPEMHMVVYRLSY